MEEDEKGKDEQLNKMPLKVNNNAHQGESAMPTRWTVQCGRVMLRGQEVLSGNYYPERAQRINQDQSVNLE